MEVKSNNINVISAHSTIGPSHTESEAEESRFCCTTTNFLVCPPNLFLACKEKYSGERDLNVLESFITGVSLYILFNKRGFLDNEIAKDFGLLLEGDAHKWWNFIRGSESRLSWEQIKRLLRIMFINKMPTFLIHDLILFREQSVFETPHYFIAYKISLFENLKVSYSEMFKVNKILNQLRYGIRQCLSFNIDSFQKLYNELHALIFENIAGIQPIKRKANFVSDRLKKIKYS